MAKVNSHANSMSIGNTHTKPYRLFDGIVGRTDVAEYRESSYAELVEAGAKGIKEIHLGIETVRKGWLQTVAVCVVLMDRQFESAIRRELVRHQSDQFKKSWEKKPDRLLDPAHITVALNAVLREGSSQEITGSAKTRLNKAVEYIQKLGCTLDERLTRLDEFQSFNELQKAVDFHRELTREGYKFPLRIDPCLTLLRFQLTGALWRSDQHGFIERCASLASS